MSCLLAQHGFYVVLPVKWILQWERLTRKQSMFNSYLVTLVTQTRCSVIEWRTGGKLCTRTWNAKEITMVIHLGLCCMNACVVCVCVVCVCECVSKQKYQREREREYSHFGFLQMTQVLISDVALPLFIHLVSREAGIFQGWCVTATKDDEQHSTSNYMQKNLCFAKESTSRHCL